jgi:hypothetical protein
MSPRASVQAIAAMLSYLVARYWAQEQMTYTHKGASPVQVWIIPKCGAHGSIRQWGNTISEELKNNLIIPRQDNFPPTDGGPIVLDTLTDSDGNVYVIKKWSVDSELVNYTIDEAVLTRTRQVGPVGV